MSTPAGPGMSRRTRRQSGPLKIDLMNLDDADLKPISRAKSPAKPRTKSPKPQASRAKSPASKPRSKSPKPRARTPSPKPTRSTPTKAPAPPTGEYAAGANWTDGGLGEGSLVPLLLFVFCPLLAQLCGYVTSEQFAPTAAIGLEGIWGSVKASFSGGTLLADLWGLVVASSCAPTAEAVKFLGGFFGLALLLERLLPGDVEHGPDTLSGHRPEYVANGFAHCVLFSAIFLTCSSLYLGLFDLGIMYEMFSPCITSLNILGFIVAAFLYYKGLHFPSTADSGTSGSFFKDFTWGTELYPRVCGVDIKRFINCRFSMTYWMLIGISCTYRSHQLHNKLDYGLLLTAASQYIYLVKFFLWEMGYMRSIDIIVDRAGWEIQWGCLVWVPAVYSFHTRVLVQSPSDLSLPVAGAIFMFGLLGVLLNYWADAQRDSFRSKNGKTTIWGAEPKFIEATYTLFKDGQAVTKKSLLLASGWWGVARHFHYVFELMAAWSWCLLANPVKNGALPLFYATFLTILLLDRAKRDERKCQLKYGAAYAQYSQMVPYLVIPGIY